MILYSPPFQTAAIPAPAGFVMLDHGQLLIRQDFAERFFARGWRTASDVLDAGDVDVFRKLPDRENGIVEWRDNIGPDCRAYIKRHYHSRVHRPRWQVVSATGSPGWDEAEASRRCRDAGVPIAPVIAAGADNGACGSRSFFMSEELLGFLPADDFAKQRIGTDPRDERRRRFIASLADVARRLHTHNLFHRDFYWCHFFVKEDGPGGPFDIRLIDLQRIFSPRWRLWRWQVKDLGQFVFSAPPGYFGPKERLEWFLRYRGRAEATGLDRLLRTAVDWRASIYRWRESDR